MGMRGPKMTPQQRVANKLEVARLMAMGLSAVEIAPRLVPPVTPRYVRMIWAGIEREWQVRAAAFADDVKAVVDAKADLALRESFDAYYASKAERRIEHVETFEETVPPPPAPEEPIRVNYDSGPAGEAEFYAAHHQWQRAVARLRKTPLTKKRTRSRLVVEENYADPRHLTNVARLLELKMRLHGLGSAEDSGIPPTFTLVIGDKPLASLPPGPEPIEADYRDVDEGDEEDDAD